MKHYRMEYMVNNKTHVKYVDRKKDLTDREFYKSLDMQVPEFRQLADSEDVQNPAKFKTLIIPYVMSVFQGNFCKDSNGNYISKGRIFKLPDIVITKLTIAVCKYGEDIFSIKDLTTGDSKIVDVSKAYTMPGWIGKKYRYELNGEIIKGVFTTEGDSK